MSDPRDFDSYQNLNANFEKREVAEMDSGNPFLILILSL